MPAVRRLCGCGRLKGMRAIEGDAGDRPVDDGEGFRRGLAVAASAARFDMAAISGVLMETID
jgi:hypothetical protein